MDSQRQLDRERSRSHTHTWPSGIPYKGREVVEPERMRAHMKTLMNIQVEESRRLEPELAKVDFTPGMVSCVLGYNIPVREYIEAKPRLQLYYRDVLRAAQFYLAWFLFQYDEEGTDEDTLFLDYVSVVERLRSDDLDHPIWDTRDEVYESIDAIGVMSLREQRDRYRERMTGMAATD